MAGNKRERELARAKYERQQARRAAAAAKRRRRNQVIAVGAVIGVVVGSVAWFVWSQRSDSDVVARPTAAATPSASSTVAPAECGPAASPKPSAPSWETAPKQTIDPKKSYEMTLKTTCGPIVIALDAAQAPKTVNSMAFLAAEGYFDDSPCHRLTTEGIFVLQCGDPTGKGTGGPGYTVPEENLPAEGAANYPAGTVAMANAGKGTTGSQFFIVYQDTTLPPDYTIWGTVTSGLETVQAVAAAGVEGGGADGAPAQPISILSASVEAT